MTIKDVENLTGMPRASIRFYEAEGLIEPEREKNGYRIYTQENVEELLRIRLLRALEVSIDEIRELAAGRLALADCLADRLRRLEEEQRRFDRSVEICRQLAAESGEFRQLDAARWLARLEEDPPARSAAHAPEQSAAAPKPGIWRRLFARGFDNALYGMLWEWLQVSLFRVNLMDGVTKSQTWSAQLAESVVILALMMLFEPIFLRRWGTTPGKWIMGIHVTNDKGERLSYREAAGRCWTLLLYGYGLGIPVLVLIREIKSLQNVWRGEEPEWEWYSRLKLREKSRIRAAVLWLLCGVLLMVPKFFIRYIPEIPPNRGELTTAEFAENFNTLQRYYEDGTNDWIFSADMLELSADIPWELDDTAHWIPRGGEHFYAWVHSGEPPMLSLDTDANGCVTEVTLRWSGSWTSGGTEDAARRGRDFQRHIFLMRVIAQAFGGAQEEMTALSGWRTVMDLIANGWQTDYAFRYKDITVAYDAEFSGCTPAENGAPELEDAAEAQTCSVSYTFIIRLLPSVS